MILGTDVLKNVVALSLGHDHERCRRIPGESEIEPLSKRTISRSVTFEALETQSVDGFKFLQEFKTVRVGELQIEHNEVNMGSSRSSTMRSIWGPCLTIRVASPGSDAGTI